jgi:2-aminoadipate transaminase
MFDSCIKHGVLYVPGDYCFHPDETGQVPKNHLRLSFGQVPLEKIESGIQRLSEVVHEQLSPQNPKSKIQNHNSE